MLGDGGTTHGQSGGEYADRLGPATQSLKYPTARGVAQTLQRFTVSHSLR
jgi:hypothetical protein